MKFLLTIYFIINPKWWLMNDPYDKSWDKKINELLDTHLIKLDPQYTARIGNNCIWVSNYPYAYGSSYNNFIGSTNHRPSRYTIWRIRKRIKLDSISKEDRRDLKLNKILNGSR